MVASFKFSIAIVLSCLIISKGLCQDCPLNKIKIFQFASGRFIQGKTEWVVFLINTCKCALQYIELNCKGFQTVEKIDEAVLLGPTGSGRCLFLNRNQLIKQNIGQFAYAFDTEYNFTVRDILLPNGTCIS
ncbi:uncharacterized protein LOC131324455 [Rhododendron vialii]|uniref:uncharacterized protein LOC131324455 n=1 Tax=Rhododendron vialii TaxID=182163 RepID=UPI00265F4ED4|nr:uncharacterized protein LOC131324455 [Rhododendron vialii]